MWKLQGGSYIPGFSGQAYGAGLQRDVTKTRKDQAKKARALQKYMSKRSSLGKWAGNIVGAGVGVGLGAMGMGPLGLTIGKTLGAGLGSRLGSSKMISGEGPSMSPGAGTGLLGSTYEQLGEAKGGIDEAMRGQAYGAGAAQLVSGLTGVAGDKLSGALKSKFGQSLAAGSGSGGLGLSAPPSSLTGGAPTLQLPKARTAIADTGSGLTGLNFNLPESLGNIPSLSADIGSQVGANSGDLSPFGQAFKTARESGLGKFMYDGMEYTTEQAQQGGYMQGYQMGGMMPGGVSNALPYQQGGEAEDKLTFGQRFVKRFPSQHEDPERAAGQERGLTSLIDFLIPQSKLDVALSALPIGALGKVGKKGIKKLIKGKRSPYNEGRTNVDMQHYTDWPENVKDDIHPSILDDVLPPRRRALGDIYDEEGRTLDLVDILESHGLQEGGYMPRYNLGGSVQQQPMAYQLGGLLKYKRSPMMG